MGLIYRGFVHLIHRGSCTRGLNVGALYTGALYVYRELICGTYILCIGSLNIGSLSME